MKYLSLRNIILISLFFRILAVIFSKGFAFSDDHFEIIEIAQSWLDGVPFTAKGEIYLFSLLYVGLHTIILGACESLGIYNPEVKMFIIRLFHALFSLFTVYYGYKLTEVLCRKSNNEIKIFNFSLPQLVGLILGIFWLFPFMSVRSLREFFCIPFLIAGFYFLLSDKNNTSFKNLVISTFLFAIAFDVRYQTIFFPLGVGLVLLFNKQTFKNAVIFGFLFIFFVSITQLLFDYLYWGSPIASIKAYTAYNATHSADYPQGDWFMYILTIGGLLLAPACFLLFIGFFYNWKKYLIIFVPTALFFLFHSYFPNKQERFILPMLPFIIILGVIGFADYYSKNNQKQWVKLGSKGLIIYFLVLNTIGLFALTFTYTKRSRVESMTYLYKKGDVKNIVFEGEGEIPFPPTFYLGKRINYFEIKADKDVKILKKEIETRINEKPNYLIITGSNNLKQREERMKTIFPNIKEEKAIAPGFVDNIAFYLNPSHNVNETWYIYKIN